MSTSSISITSAQPFATATRINRSLTAAAEKRALLWLAPRIPRWINSDHLTALGLAAQVAAGISFALARYNRLALLATILCIILNWLGDSLDGTLARVRRQQRPRYGFYVDHIVDIFGATALLTGLACSGFMHWPIALAMLIAFLLLAGESYLATYTLSRFELSQSFFGPTELRLLLIAGCLALLRSPFSTVAGHRLLLFDIGGSIATVGMLVTVLYVSARHTAELYCEEPLR